MILFIGSIFASAFLLFMVQPMVGKHILPWFGGGTGVWTLCLTFYQSTLFLGYAYAHLLIRKVPPSRQPLVHALVLAGALAALPVLPDASWQPEPGADPSVRILGTLVANVGLPFFLLAASGPLVQAWFARVFPSRSPYPLYAASNLGSLVALVSFPLVIEPAVALSRAAHAWSWAFAACGVSLLGCAWRAVRGARGSDAALVAGSATSSGSTDVREGLLWIALSVVAVVLLLGVTNELCLDVASIPFLWVLPLSIYLSTLIACFSSDRAYHRGVFAVLAAASTLVLIAVWLSSNELGWWSGSPSIRVKIGVYSVALLAWCMLMHGELYRLRPPPARLTSYYLCISGGGALGGLFVGIAAPRLFSDYYELPIGLVACWLLFLAACWRDPAGPFQASAHRGAWRAASIAGAALLAAGTGFAARPERPGVLLRERNFFGVLTVSEVRTDDPPRYQLELSSGSTLHGVQLIRPAPRRPTAYFGFHTGIGFVMRARDPGARTVMGVVGLGSGTLAAYGRAGDRFRFYEIDPNVIRVARDDGRFTFLRDSPAEIEVVPGDARLSLQSELREGRPQRADLLVLDAFNSDAIPMHLLTVEAFELYARHVAEDGVIAFHVSTHHLDLVPLVFRLAQHVGLRAVAVVNEDHGMSFGSRWVILSRDEAYLDALVDLACRDPDAPPRVWFPDADLLDGVPLWTDDYSDLFRILAPVSAFRDRSAGEDACAGRRAPRSGQGHR